MSSIAWGAVTIPLLSILILGNPSRPFASQYGGFYELDKGLPFGRMKPCARIHGSVSKVPARFHPPTTSLAGCLCVVHKHTTNTVALNLSLSEPFLVFKTLDSWPLHGQR